MMFFTVIFSPSIPKINPTRRSLGELLTDAVHLKQCERWEESDGEGSPEKLLPLSHYNLPSPRPPES